MINSINGRARALSDSKQTWGGACNVVWGVRCGVGRAMWCGACDVVWGVRCGVGRAMWGGACDVGWDV